MLNPLTKWFSNIWYFTKGFFPVQLFLLHLRRSYIVMIFWIILFLFISARLGASYGFQYLFLSPEYLSQVSFLSYFLVGIMAGLFVMAFHISSYIYYSYRYPFLATLSRPLYKFCINNSIIPLVFYTVYIVLIANLLSADGKSTSLILVAVGGLLLGSILTIALTLGYFFTTIKSVEPQTGAASRALDQIVNKKQSEKGLTTGRKAVVNHYLKNFISVKLTRDVDHYDKQRLLDTIQSHHTSAFFYFLLLIVLVVAVNLLGATPYLRIPAGASVFLIFSLYLMITGAVYTRFKTWTLSLGILTVLVINYLSGLPDFKRTYYAYGLDYEVPKAAYTYENLKALTSDSIVAYDKREIERVLNRWKAQTGEEKPKLILLNASGGGLRSSLFTLNVLQTLDSTLGADFYPNVHLIAGSSGGMLGASYYRQLKYESSRRKDLKANDLQHVQNMGQDLLNPIAFNLAVNDLFWRWRTFEYNGQAYLIDRGKAFDDKLEENTMGLLSGAFGDWREAEYQAQMPTMVLAPTIIGDGRKLLMSNLGISFLTFSQPPPGISLTREYDAVEYSRLFKEQRYGDLRFTTALRMSASFPYITPLVNMPSKPTIELIDAGARDNEGFELGLRYILKMKDWIAENTSGVVVVQIKANRPDEVPIEEPGYSRLSQIVKPFGGIIRSFGNLQIYNKALLMELSESSLDFPVDLVRYSLFASEDELSLSWHLTEREKAYILEAMQFERNQRSLERLRTILKP
jgi:hypothetical protein